MDVKVDLYDGADYEVESSEMAFKMGGSMAFKEAMRKGDPVLLEPIMKVTVITPDDYLGDVIGDLNSRRGQIWMLDMAYSRLTPLFHCPKCSVTLPTCVLRHRAVVSTPWNLLTM